MYFVYLLECKDKSIYTGITTDVARRVKEHKAGGGGHYTRAKGVKRLLYSEKYKDRSSALKREVEIKKLPKGQKLNLIKKS